jgi:hypothetical protein
MDELGFAIYKAVAGSIAEHMGANLLPCNAAVRLQARAPISKHKGRASYGEGDRVLHPEPLS